MRLADRRSIVAIDPTHRGIAFVYFRDGQLLDWGTRNATQAGTALDRILAGLRVDAIVLEEPNAVRCERQRRVRAELRELADEAGQRGIAVVRVSRARVRQGWRERHVTTKQAVAAEIAQVFPALQSVLPPPRKIYRSEDARIQIFDAASLVIHAFGLLST